MPLRVRKNAATPPVCCPLTECMQLLAGAWAPNVIWYLSHQPRRFGELRLDIPPISARVLSARLRELEDKGVLERVVRASSPPSVEYQLTALGRELVPAIAAIVEVGRKLKAVPRVVPPAVKQVSAARSRARASGHRPAVRSA